MYTAESDISTPALSPADYKILISEKKKKKKYKNNI